MAIVMTVASGSFGMGGAPPFKIQLPRKNCRHCIFNVVRDKSQPKLDQCQRFIHEWQGYSPEDIVYELSHKARESEAMCGVGGAFFEYRYDIIDF